MKVTEEIFDLADVKQIKNPNLADLESYMQQSHPYKQNQCEYTRCETCQFDTGCHSCIIGETSEKSSVDQYGVAATLYFRFVKNLSMWFFLFSIAATIPILFYIKAFTQSSIGDKQFTASEKLTATTLGSLVIDRTQCQFLRFRQNTNIQDEQDYILSLTCSSGTLPTKISDYYYGLINSEHSESTDDDNSVTSCVYIDLNDVDQTCNSTDVSKLEGLIKDSCYGKSSCEVELNDSIFLSDCSEKVYKKNVYFNTFCDNASYELKWKFEKLSVVIVSSVIDAGIVICFMFLLIKLRLSEQETERNVISNSIGISYFTIEFTNLPKQFNAEELKTRLWSHLQNSVQKASRGERFNIYDIQLATPNHIICSEKKIRTLEKKKLQLILEYCTKFSVQSQNNQVSMSQINQNYRNIVDKQVNIQARKRLTKLQKINEQIEKEKQLLKVKLKGNEEIKSAFVTFETMRMRDIAYYTMYQTQLDKLIESCFFCCKNKNDMRRQNLKIIYYILHQVKEYLLMSFKRIYHLQIVEFECKLLEVKKPPTPEDIIWQNLSMSFINKLLRRLLSLLITIVFLIGTLVLIVYVKKENKSFTDKYPVINCPNNSDQLTTPDIVKDYESQIKKGLLDCYCKIDTFGRYNHAFKMSDGSTEYLCEKWVQDQTLILVLPFMVVLAIILINFIMQHIFTFLSKFEGYSYVSNQISSRVAKIFFMQFMNTALIILIMNTKFESNYNSSISYLLDGTFTDFVPMWFKTVGSTILLTMIIYIIIPYINFFLGTLYYACRQWYDRKFTCDKSQTRKKTQEAYENVYLGPNFLIEVRYAQIMNILFVCLLYCVGLPALIITTFLFLFSTYYIDKFVMLRMCRDPPQYNKHLEDVVRSILWIAVPLHCLMSIWMLGSPKMFAGSIRNSILEKISDKVDEFHSDYYIFEDFYKRAIKPQCVPQLISLALFLLYVVFLIIKKRIIIPLFKCCCCCFNFAEDDLISKKNELSQLPIHACNQQLQINTNKIKIYLKIKVITKQSLKIEIKTLAKKINETQNEKFKKFLQEKYNVLTREFSTRKKKYDKNAQAEALEKRNFNCTLVGLFSYDIEVKQLQMKNQIQNNHFNNKQKHHPDFANY